MSITAAQRLVTATQELAASSETPRLDAELLMAHALGISRNALLLRARDLAAPANFESLLARRKAHEPVAYIRGVQEFWDLTLNVTPATLIPRGDSETLIEAAAAFFDRRHPPERILDLGTGSGALLLAALSLFPDAHGIAIDASADALTVAQANGERVGFGHRSAFLHRSWHEAGWNDNLGRFNLILCNPPYVETDAELSKQVRVFEPASALFAGADGLDEYRHLIPMIGTMLTDDGIAILEIGRGQDLAVSELARTSGFEVTTRQDLSGIVRALSLSKFS